MQPTSKKPTRVVKRGSVTKSVEKKSGDVVTGEESEEKSIPVDLQAIANPAFVEIGTAYTHNLGNYEFVKISCSISMPCEPKPKEIKKTKDKIAKMVDAIMKEELDKITEEKE
jgi:hypothetical protein